MKIHLIAALAAILNCSACVSGLSDQAFAPFRVAPGPDVITDVHSANPGDVILSQQAAPIGMARADGDGSATIPPPAIALFPATVSVHQGDELFRVVLRNTPSVRAYCTQAVSSLPVEGLIRSCFSDENKDGRFDRAWAMVVERRNEGVGGGTMVSAPGAVVSIPYTVMSDGSMPSQTLRIVFGSGGFYAFMGDRYLEDGRVFYVTHGPYPRTIDLAGARIEVLGYVRGRVGVVRERVDYRIIRGFPVGMPIASM